MSIFGKLLNSFDSYLTRRENRRIEAYLSQAKNLGDLEYRMRLLDSKTKPSPF